jgi:hypothetical protein
MSRTWFLLSLLVVLVVGAVASTSASAFNREWEVCEEGTGTGTKYTEHKCTTSSGTGAWEWKVLPAGKSWSIVAQGGTFVLRGITQTINCKKLAHVGTIYGGVPGTDEENGSFTECITANIGCKVKSAGGTFGTIKVPDHPTKLEERSSKLVDNFEQNATAKEFVTLEFSPAKVTGNVTGIVGGGELNFPGPGSALKTFGATATLTGTSSQELANGWAVRAS